MTYFNLFGAAKSRVLAQQNNKPLFLDMCLLFGKKNGVTEKVKYLTD